MANGRKYILTHIPPFLQSVIPFKQFSSNARILCQSVPKEKSENLIHASELPCPPKVPFLGNLLYVMRHKDFDKKKIYKVIEAISKEYGPTFRMEMPAVEPFVFFTRPEEVQEMYALTLSNPIRQGFFSLKSVRDNAEGDVFAKKAGILPENNPEWWRVRSQVQGPMLKLQYVRTYISAMDEVSTEFVDSIPGMLDDKKEAPDDFLMEIYKWALESIGTVTLNTRLGCLAQDLPAESEQVRLIEAVNSVLENLFKAEIFPLWKIYKNRPYRELAKAHEEVRRIIEKYIQVAEKSLNEGKKEDSRLTLLEAFLKSKSLSRTDVVTMILDIFIGGIDTTSHTVGFVLYELACNKENQILLQKEIDSVLGDGSSPIKEADFANFTYLKACIKETLRLYPIVTGGLRQFDKDVVINNIHIPKGWQGMFSNCLMGRDESLFTRAEEFLPERWLKNKPLGTFHPYASLPFSHGTRNCIGRRIAEQEMYILLARILHRYNVSYHHGEMEYDQHLVLAPAKSLKFQFTLRK